MAERRNQKSGQSSYQRHKKKPYPYTIASLDTAQRQMRVDNERARNFRLMRQARGNQEASDVSSS